MLKRGGTGGFRGGGKEGVWVGVCVCGCGWVWCVGCVGWVGGGGGGGGWVGGGGGGVAQLRRLVMGGCRKHVQVCHALQAPTEVVGPCTCAVALNL